MKTVTIDGDEPEVAIKGVGAKVPQLSVEKGRPDNMMISRSVRTDRRNLTISVEKTMWAIEAETRRHRRRVGEAIGNVTGQVHPQVAGDNGSKAILDGNKYPFQPRR